MWEGDRIWFTYLVESMVNIHESLGTWLHKLNRHYISPGKTLSNYTSFQSCDLLFDVQSIKDDLRTDGTQGKLKTVFKLDHSFIKLFSWLSEWLYLNISTKLQIYQLFSILQHPKTSIMPPYSVMIRANFRQRSTLTHAHAHTHTNWNYLHTCSKRLHTNRKCLVFIILYGLYCCTQGHHDFYFCFTFVRGCYF